MNPITDDAANTVYRRPLAVYVVWHPESVRAERLARALFRHLCQDPEKPLERGLQIPVRFRSRPGLGETTLPASVPLDPSDRTSAVHTAIVILGDNEMLLERDKWGPYIANMWRHCEAPASPHRVFPVMVSPNAPKLDPAIAENQFIRLPEERSEQFLCNRVTHELCRLLLNRPRGETETASGPAPVKIFLSHAKSDGRAIAKSILDYIGSNMQMKTFFDEVDIPLGSKWEKVLDEESARLAVLAIQTDKYATRPWCQREILNAKDQNVPIAVVNAVVVGEARGFPYLGNTPTVRWHPDDPHRFEDVLGLLLLEVLRHTFFTQRMKGLEKLYDFEANREVLASAPELLMASRLRRSGRWKPGALIIYPDPPLGSDELDRLRDIERDVQVITPTMLPACVGFKVR